VNRAAATVAEQLSGHDVSGESAVREFATAAEKDDRSSAYRGYVVSECAVEKSNPCRVDCATVFARDVIAEGAPPKCYLPGNDRTSMRGTAVRKSETRHDARTYDAQELEVWSARRCRSSDGDRLIPDAVIYNTSVGRNGRERRKQIDDVRTGAGEIENNQVGIAKVVIRIHDSLAE
jgi:hypothetical protein